MLRLKDRINLNEDTMAEPKQTIEYINIKDLVLWTENPRDPVDENATDQDIAKRIIEEGTREKWKLQKLFKSMGKRYDYSELPTVVPVKGANGKHVVYDGNRRILIGKIIYGFVSVGIDLDFDFKDFDFPKEIPCNVCDESTALEHVDRKHGDNGTWGELERDIFKHYRMEEDKSDFLVIDEATGIISNYPFMNKRFVKDEIFTPSNLKKLGILIKDGVLKTPYRDDAFKEILNKIIELVYSKKISTRENRGELISLLKKDDSTKGVISKNKGNKAQPYKGKKSPVVKKYTEPTKKEKIPLLFGEDSVILKKGVVNDLFLDLKRMHVESYKGKYTPHFPMIIRMGLRLLCHVDIAELVPKLYAKRQLTKKEMPLDDYIKNYFDSAKQKLNVKECNFLHEYDVKKDTMTDVLNMGAHGNSYKIGKDKTIALSLILGKILAETDDTGKKK